MEPLEKLISQEPYWDDQMDKILMEPYEYLANKHSKNFRTKLILLFNKFYQLDDNTVYLISQFVEKLHNSSLLIDDIEDSSIWRRGYKTSHLVYGIPMTLNTANYVYFDAMKILCQLTANDQSLLNKLLIIFNEEMLNLHRGQALDIYWRDNFMESLTETSYYNMVMNKTGGLFRLTVRLMETLSQKQVYSLISLSNLLGILYQIRDDYLNLCDSDMIKNKGFADDISEGKLSFPIIHGIRYGIEHGDTVVSDGLKLHSNDIDIKANIINYLTNTSRSLEYTKEKISELGQLIKSKYIPNNDSELQNIVDYLSGIMR